MIKHFIESALMLQGSPPGVKVMDFDREYPAGCVAGRQPDIYPEPVIPG